MKILQICKKVPWPLHDGEAIAVYAMAKGLVLQGNEVSLLAMNTIKHEKQEASISNHLNYYSSVRFVSVDNRIGVKGIFSNLLLSRNPIHVDRLISDDFEGELISVVQETNFDIILMETIFSSHCLDTLRLVSNSKLIIRNHNVEHLIWKRLSNLLPTWKSWYYHSQAHRLKRYEKRQLEKADLIIPLSVEDERGIRDIGVKTKSKVVPIGLDLDDYKIQDSVDERDIFKICFIGSLDWEPNLQGLSWFIDEVWSRVNSSNLKNRVELHIAGKHMPNRLRELSLNGIVIHQEVSDAISFINNHSAMIVPLFAGSGQRVKILQALALGKIVLSSTIGIEGIHAENERHFLKCNTKEDFFKGIEEIVDGKIVLSKSNIREKVQTHYDLIELGKQVNKALQKIID